MSIRIGSPNRGCRELVPLQLSFLRCLTAEDKGAGENLGRVRPVGAEQGTLEVRDAAG
jgi:hypothetical protein